MTRDGGEKVHFSVQHNWLPVCNTIVCIWAARVTTIVDNVTCKICMRTKAFNRCADKVLAKKRSNEEVKHVKIVLKKKRGITLW